MFGAQPLKINDNGTICGWSREDVLVDCWVVAAWWPDPASSPVALGRFNGLGLTEQSVAYGMNETSPLTVVGTSLDAFEAYRWQQQANGTWDPSTAWKNLNDADILAGDCEGVWTLVEAFDANDDGWIVGWGLKGGEARGFLLIPESQQPTCAADLSQCPDGVVDVFDLFVLLDNWGTDGPGAGLAEPLDVVDVFDLFQLLSSWGVCGFPYGPVPQSAQECYEKFQNDPEALEQCLWAIEQLN